jgi:hypothetical protein
VKKKQSLELYLLKRNKKISYIGCKKKLVPVLLVTLSIILLSSCQKKGGNGNINTADTDTTDSQTETVGETTGETNPETGQEPQARSIKDYYPFQSNIVYRYEGSGNEYASYDIYTDYLKGDRLQLRSNNGGSETVRVIELKDGLLTQVLLKGECYYRENLLERVDGEGEVLLKEPLTPGTEWTLSDNRKRYISGSNVSITTPSGSYEALEVTTEGNGDKLIDYYAPGVGLVKSIYTASGTEVVSSLSKIEQEVPFKQTVRFFYPDVEKEVIYWADKELSFQTNDITSSKLAEEIKKIAEEKAAPVISVNTKINDLYLNKDNIVYVDFSKELVNDMKAGAAYENRILQCIANTLGSYYGVNQVCLTVEGKPYTSGHISMKKGDTIKVNLDKAVK